MLAILFFSIFIILYCINVVTMLATPTNGDTPIWQVVFLVGGAIYIAILIFRLII